LNRIWNRRIVILLYSLLCSLKLWSYDSSWLLSLGSFFDLFSRSVLRHLNVIWDFDHNFILHWDFLCSLTLNIGSVHMYSCWFWSLRMINCVVDCPLERILSSWSIMLLLLRFLFRHCFKNFIPHLTLIHSCLQHLLYFSIRTRISWLFLFSTSEHVYFTCRNLCFLSKKSRFNSEVLIYELLRTWISS